jgi:CO/xanthine dehydrogenase Mo-binding subunit
VPSNDALPPAANAKYAHRLAKLDLATSCDMRAPSAATALYALESAMDELAVALRLDPLELRLRCYSDRDQNDDRPYSSKALRECYRQGADAFGWDRRNPAPRSMRDGSELVGWGMATGKGVHSQIETGPHRSIDGCYATLCGLKSDVALSRQCAMCGRLRVGKDNLHVAGLVGAAMCSAC